MESLHLRAEPETIDMIISFLNKASKDGQEIELLDNTLYEREQKIIFKALLEEKTGETFNHDDIWDELLK